MPEPTTSKDVSYAPLLWPAAGGTVRDAARSDIIGPAADQIEMVWRADEAVPPDTRPTLLMFFHLECAGCVSRGIPFMKALHKQYGERLQLIAVHTSRGHRQLPREEVLPTLLHFASSFAKLPFPVVLDGAGALAEAYATEGTPHWIALERGEMQRSIYGSQDNARTRLEYWLEEVLGE